LEITEEKHRETLQDTGIDNDFLHRTPIVQEIRARIAKWDCIKLKTSSQQRKQLPE
jgi:hypothetical protein